MVRCDGQIPYASVKVLLSVRLNANSTGAVSIGRIGVANMMHFVKQHLPMRISWILGVVLHRLKRPTQVELRADDLFLVSYPRSGNTWVRFLFANLMRKPDAGKVDFHTLINYVPELGLNDHIIVRMKGPRVIKSHANFREEFSNVIYIIRDARDAYVSYYHYLKHQLPQDMTFAEFLANLRNCVPLLWSEHVYSWLLAPRQNSWLLAARQHRLLVVRYEDLVRDCARELRRMVEFANMTATEQAVADAVRLSSFKEVQHLERERGRPYQAEAPSQFVRRGQPGNWRAYFGELERKVFPARDKEMLVRLGYARDKNW